MNQGNGFQEEMTLVRTRRNHESFSKLTSDTKAVHLRGYPFRWALDEIIDRAPNVQIVEMGPSAYRVLPPGYLLRMKDRGIAVRVGCYHCYAPHQEPRASRAPHYGRFRFFLLNLNPEQKERFEKLRSREVKAILITARYFCLKRERFIPMRRIAVLYGMNPRYIHGVSRLVRGVLHFLDSRIPVGNGAQEVSKNLQEKYDRIKKKEIALAEEKQQLHKLGLSYIPKGMPKCRLSLYAAILLPRNQSRLKRLRKKQREIVSLRLGLSGKVYSLNEIGRMYGHSRQAIHQQEQRALEKLGLEQ